MKHQLVLPYCLRKVCVVMVVILSDLKSCLHEILGVSCFVPFGVDVFCINSYWQIELRKIGTKVFKMSVFSCVCPRLRSVLAYLPH